MPICHIAATRCFRYAAIIDERFMPLCHVYFFRCQRHVSLLCGYMLARRFHAAAIFITIYVCYAMLILPLPLFHAMLCHVAALIFRLMLFRRDTLPR